MKRMIFMYKIKEECIEQYKEYHRNVWPELEKTYKDAGIMKVSCFLNGPELLVYSEYDENIYPASRPELIKNEVEMRWQKIMKTLSDTTFKSVEYQEVYRME